MLVEQLQKFTKPVIIMPVHYRSFMLYHALVDAGVKVQGFWDNNADLSNKTYDGVPVSLPNETAFVSDDVTIIVFYKKYEEEICKQLSDLGYNDLISAQSLELDELDKYYDYVIDKDLYNIAPKYERTIYTKNGLDPLWPVPLDSIDEFFMFISNKTGIYKNYNTARKVLLLSHDMSLSGAPILLHDAARVIADSGGLPVICSNTDGKLVAELVNDDIPVIIDYRLGSRQSETMTKLFSLFDIVIVNTYTCISLIAIECLNKLSVPAIWWIHEGSMFYTDMMVEKMPCSLRDNIHVYCGGNYAKTMLKSAGAKFPIEVLLYGLKDIREEQHESSPDTRLKFVTIGTIDFRKGQDIFCEAIRKLDRSVHDRCEFHFVGKMNNMMGGLEINNKVLALHNDFPDNVILRGEVERRNIGQVLRQCDCMVCSSRDDPMPLFIAEAMMFGKVCICSENTGYNDLIEDGVNGFIYGNNSHDELCKKITYVAENYTMLNDMRTKSRETYDRFFSYEKFGGNLIKILDSITIYGR